MSTPIPVIQQAIYPLQGATAYAGANKVHIAHGSCRLFDYHVHVAFIPDGRDSDKYAMVAKVIVYAMRRLDIPPNTLFKCSIGVAVNITEGRLGSTHLPDLGIHSCIVGGLQNGASFAIPASSGTSFGAKEKIWVTKVSIKFEPLQMELPAKYAVLVPSCLTSFNDPDLSDCSILPSDSADPIHVSRAILARASPYFVTMFKGAWAEFIRSDVPIEFGWSASALLPCLIHMYSGWVVGEPLPDAAASDAGESGAESCSSASGVILHKYDVDLAAVTVHQLMELMDLARLLELRVLMGAVSREMVKVLGTQIAAVDVELKEKAKLISASVSGLNCV